MTPLPGRVPMLAVVTMGAASYPAAELLFAPALPVAAAISGIAIILSALAASRRRIATVPAALLVAAGLALAASAFADRQLSDATLVMATTLGASAVVVIGTGTTMPAPARILLVTAGVAALLGYFAAVSGHGVDGRYALYPVLVSSIVLAWVRPAPVVPTPLPARPGEVAV
ncbi:hypothetical protein [Mycolicibacterium bacteremicum]|nr:hypothetical protein [Mycolicibacterium bacteremicum]MCV7434052.1 hypothetical protein [Mycolicibacterium bacteremicum]